MSCDHKSAIQVNGCHYCGGAAHWCPNCGAYKMHGPGHRWQYPRGKKQEYRHKNAGARYYIITVTGGLHHILAVVKNGQEYAVAERDNKKAWKLNKESKSLRELHRGTAAMLGIPIDGDRAMKIIVKCKRRGKDV